MLTKIVMTLAAVAFAVTTLAPANAAPGGGGFDRDGIWSPYGAGQGAPQIDGAGGN